MDFDVCENYKGNPDIDGLNIGYAIHSGALFIIIPSLSIITNIGVLFTYLRKTSIANKKQASMEKMLHIITLIETCISLYWLLNGIIFYKTDQLYEKCLTCFSFSIVSVFLYMADIIFLTFTIDNLMKIITDPIEGILKPNVRLNMYLLFTLAGSLILTLLSYMAKVYGRSPMLTCFIRTEFQEISQQITLSLFLFIPCSFFVYSIYLCFKMCCNRKVIHDSNLSKLFYKYMSIIILYFVLKFPLLLLFWLSINYKIMRNTFLSWLSFTSAIITVSIPLIITMLRLCHGYVKLDFWNRSKRKVKTNKRNSLINDQQTGLLRTMTKTEEFEWLEKKVLETFLSDIFIGICTCLKNSKYSGVNDNAKTNSQKLSKKECLELNEIYINEENIKIEDDLVKSLGIIEVKFTEFAPKVFQQLRKIENLEEEDLIE